MKYEKELRLLSYGYAKAYYRHLLDCVGVKGFEDYKGYSGVLEG